MMTLDQKQLQQMTPEDVRNAKIIGLLLIVGKMLGGVTRAQQSGPNSPESETAGPYVLSFIEAAVGLHGDGVQLEKDTLALAKQLGFEIEQRQMSGVAHA
jgi:hypothetical protein